MNDTGLTEAEIADLRCLAGIIVPASAKYDVPGADDPRIVADIAASLGHDTDRVRQALGRLAALSGGPFCNLGAEGRKAVAASLRAEGGPALAALTRHVLLCYYRDDRVMLSLGLELRAPFPQGHVVEQGDWSLLDPVKQRAPFWRRVE